MGFNRFSYRIWNMSQNVYGFVEGPLALTNTFCGFLQNQTKLCLHRYIRTPTARNVRVLGLSNPYFEIYSVSYYTLHSLSKYTLGMDNEPK